MTAILFLYVGDAALSTMQNAVCEFDELSKIGLRSVSGGELYETFSGACLHGNKSSHQVHRILRDLI